MNQTHYKLQGAVVLLQNGKVLVAGGADQAEVFDPKTNKFDAVSGKFESMRLFATATRLQNGQVLIVGGYDQRGDCSEKSWIYKS